jgi:RNA polymerase sigma factor (sigma-70 family)
VRAYRIPTQHVDDIVQTTFVRLYEHIGSIRDPNALPAWLDTTARRETSRAIRAALRERPVDVEILEHLAAPAAADDHYDAWLNAELAEAIERLPLHQRILLRRLASVDEPSYEDISRELGMPIGSIGPTRGRAMERLRRDARLIACAEMDAESRAERDSVPPMDQVRSWRKGTETLS